MPPDMWRRLTPWMSPRRSDRLGGWERMSDARHDEWIFDLYRALHDEQDNRR